MTDKAQDLENQVAALKRELNRADKELQNWRRAKSRLAEMGIGEKAIQLLYLPKGEES